MFKVYFEDNTIIFTAGGDTLPPGGAVWEPAANEVTGITKMLEKIGNNKLLCVVSAEPEVAFERFCSQFVQVEAAGGMVSDPGGDLLMILRNGRWDLPKGHIEHGETPVEGAVREVSEETGLDPSGITDCRLSVTTRHFYRLSGQWRMKHTWWFTMRATRQQLTAQTEEGITRVEWVPTGKIAEYTGTCFSSVREVLHRSMPLYFGNDSE